MTALAGSCAVKTRQPPARIAGTTPTGLIPAIAAAILAGVNPVQGLYASFAGPITGGLTANTRLMVITTTSASALAAGSALSGVPAAQRPAAVPVVAIIAGAALVAAGLLKLGRYTRFVSYSHGWCENRPTDGMPPEQADQWIAAGLASGPRITIHWDGMPR